MGELSGFGDGYEDLCRAMLRAGLQWLDDHPNVVVIRGIDGVLGFAGGDPDDDVNGLLALLYEAGGSKTSVRMVEVVTHALGYVLDNGWPAFVVAMKQRGGSGQLR